MRGIAVINQKGGVGKTTTSVNLGAALVRLGRRVLLIDMDPQAHASLHVGVETGPGDATIYEVLTGKASLAEAARYVDERLAVVPAHLDLVAAGMELSDRAGRDRALADALASYREHFDVMLIDCAPSLGVLTVCGLAAADEVLIPLQPHFLALQGLGKLLETVSAVRDAVQPTLCVGGVVFCMWEGATKLAQEVFTDVQSFLSAEQGGSAWQGARVFDTRIRRNIKLAECPSFGKTIFQYAPGSHGAADYAALAEEVLAMRPVAAAAAEIEALTDIVATAPAEVRAV